MSLTSIKSQKEFEAGALTDFKARIDAIIGKNMQWEVEAASFARTDFGTDFFDNEEHVAQFHKYCFDRLETVFTKLCADPDFKSAIAENMTTIKIVPKDDTGVRGGSCVVQGGVLTMMAHVYADLGPLDDEIEMMISEAINNMS